VPIVVTLGYLFGNELEVVLHYIGGVEKMVWVVVALSLGVIAMRMLMFTREHGETPT
jgi:membrane protein DedA with SNARE-associated domain